MRIAAIVCFTFCLVTGSGGAAADEVYEPHALLYYQVSFSGRAQDRKSSFGLRLDQTHHASGEAPEFTQLLARPALAELRMDGDGVRSLNIAGTDLTRAYRVHRADEQGAAPEAPAAGESTAGEPAADQPAAEDSKETSGDEEKDSLGDYLEAAPAGYLIGIALGVVLLTGLGD